MPVSSIFRKQVNTPCIPRRISFAHFFSITVNIARKRQLLACRFTTILRQLCALSPAPVFFVKTASFWPSEKCKMLIICVGYCLSLYGGVKCNHFWKGEGHEYVLSKMRKRQCNCFYSASIHQDQEARKWLWRAHEQHGKGIDCCLHARYVKPCLEKIQGR